MNTPSLQIAGIIIPVTPHPEHEYTLTTTQVAVGYGVSESTIKEHKRQHLDELFAGKHFVEVRNPDFQPGKGGAHTYTHWTKRGIIRLGFFIKSERAKQFRDLAEDLILRASEPAPYGSSTLAEAILQLTGEVRELRQLFSGAVSGAPKDVAPVTTQPVTVTEHAVTASPMAAWVVELATRQVEAGLDERHYSMPELLAQCPPLPPRVANKSVALGQRLAVLTGTPIPMDAGRRAVIVPMRSSHTRGWLLQVSQVM